MKKIIGILLIVIIGYIILFIVPIKKVFNPNMRCIQAPCGYEPQTLFEFFQEKQSKIDDLGRYVGAGCKIASGCNGVMHCVSKMMPKTVNSICNYLPEYACYFESGMRCEKQDDGLCGWTKTEDLNRCVEDTEINNNF